MALVVFRCTGGEIVLPNRNLVLVDREDGGNLLVNPPREVWERSELSAAELTNWSFLVAATGRAMLDELAQLKDGCINYWEAGNWSLNEAADPVGKKYPRQHRRVHLHLLGRNPRAKSPDFQWGEAPRFPDFADRLQWASQFQQLTAHECSRVVTRAEELLKQKYDLSAADIKPWSPCQTCGYPSPSGACAICQT